MAAAEVQGLVPSASIENLLAKRTGIVERIRRAHAELMEAALLSEELFGRDDRRGPSLSLYSGHHRTRKEFTCVDGAATLVSEVDAAAWGFLLDQSGLRTFLDAEARDSWRKAIDSLDVPELTQENIEHTFRALYDRRGEMFERGVVELFRKLSWDYRTNNPRMLGKRIILRFVIDGRGWYLNTTGTDKLDDLVRVMSVLDGKLEPDHRQGAWRRLTDMKWPKEVQVADLGYFKARGFKNGNAHITFLRPELVDRMNQIIAKHSAHVLPPAEDAEG